MRPGRPATANGWPSSERPRPTLSKAQRSYRYIRERINDGRYVPGFRLVLGQIAKELDVSVVPVREAIRLLEAEASSPSSATSARRWR